MPINLQKGQTINLEKDQFDLSSVTIGLGWDVTKKEKGFFSSLFASAEDDDYDLDAIAFLLNKDGKVANVGNQKLEGGDVIFFNNLRHTSGNVYHTGDNRTGDGDGDDEQLIVKLNRIGSEYEKIVFLVSIYQGIQKNQNFGQVDNAFIRAVDAKNHEILRYDLSHDHSFDGKCSMVFGELYRHNGNWKFRAIGMPYETDNFVEILKHNYL
ncbi:MAG: TerD family protein [Thermoguttaceae bacterium]|nr:TerD family protein [Thermoguttaceae bacterium]